MKRVRNDDDFVIGTEDIEVENPLILSGPSGSGKTMTVDILFLWLGFFITFP